MFRLASVLNLREQEEAIAKEALAAEMLAERRMAEVYAAALARVDQAAGRLTPRVGQVVHGDRLLAADHHLRLMEGQARQADGALQMAKSRVDTSRSQLAAAKQRTEALQKLRARQLEEHRRRLLAAEQANLDEIGKRMRSLTSL